jgi:uncharacterized protein YdhG (YjbR/CyaY superfamily)
MITDHDDYIAQAPESFRPILARIRTQLSAALPDAEEVIAYQMPGFKIGQTIIAGFAAFSKQCGLYIAPAAIKIHAVDISKAGLKATKTGVTFSPKKSIPDELMRKLAVASRNAHEL